MKTKTKKAPTAWHKHLMSVYHEMKKEDKDIRLKDAMKVAKKSYKKQKK